MFIQQHAQFPRPHLSIKNLHSDLLYMSTMTLLVDMNSTEPGKEEQADAMCGSSRCRGRSWQAGAQLHPDLNPNSKPSCNAIVRLSYSRSQSGYLSTAPDSITLLGCDAMEAYSDTARAAGDLSAICLGLDGIVNSPLRPLTFHLPRLGCHQDARQSR